MEFVGRLVEVPGATSLLGSGWNTGAFFGARGRLGGREAIEKEGSVRFGCC